MRKTLSEGSSFATRDDEVRRGSMLIGRAQFIEVPTGKMSAVRRINSACGNPSTVNAPDRESIIQVVSFIGLALSCDRIKSGVYVLSGIPNRGKAMSELTAETLLNQITLLPVSE